MIRNIVKSILHKTGLKHSVKNLLNTLRALSLDKIEQLAQAGNLKTGIKHVTFYSKAEYDRYILYYADELYERTALENRLLAAVGKPFVVHANSFLLKSKSNYQIFCRKTVDGRIESNLRESCVCVRTGLNSRIRATLYVMLNRYHETELRDKKFYLTEAVTDLYKLLQSRYSSVEGSEFLGGDIKSGTVINGIRHEDITQMSYTDAQFDLGICLEVLEHVPDYKEAFTELARITKKGGSFLITVPFLENSDTTLIRARLKHDGSIEHILPPEYHGDPVNVEGGILCFQHFGWDMVDDLKKAGFSNVAFHFVWSFEEVMLGRHLLVIEAIK